MAKPEWGKKRTCQNCGAKYYDLQKDPPTCPKCDTVFQVEQTTRGRRSRATAEAPKAIPAAAAAAAVNENSGVVVLDETDESIPEDTSDLVGDDDDDVGAVIDTGESKLDDN
ncbi:MAG: TIGR02300 family protein [Pseudomonadota bacterium]|nr:TIGR02300 family protein [Pseudomonadota bacterium]